MLRTLKNWAFAGLVSVSALATPLAAQSYGEQDSYAEACQAELNLAYRWNIMLVRDHFTTTVEIFDKVTPVPQAYLWTVDYFPHPTYRGGSKAAYNAMKPLAKQFLEQLSDEEKSCVIIHNPKGPNTNFGPLGALLESLS